MQLGYIIMSQISLLLHQVLQHRQDLLQDRLSMTSWKTYFTCNMKLTICLRCHPTITSILRLMRHSSRYKGINFLLNIGGMQCWPFYPGDISVWLLFSIFKLHVSYRSAGLNPKHRIKQRNNRWSRSNQ